MPLLHISLIVFAIVCVLFVTRGCGLLTNLKDDEMEQPSRLFQHFKNKETLESHKRYVRENVANGTIKF